MEEVALAVGEIIGHGSVKSAAQINSAVVLFLEKVEQVNRLVETGITVNGMFEPVIPLIQPAIRITLSNVGYRGRRRSPTRPGGAAVDRGGQWGGLCRGGRKGCRSCRETGGREH